MSAVVVPLEGDARGFRRALSEARADALASGARISDALEQVGRAIAKRQGDIKVVAQEFRRFGAEVVPALGPVQGAIDALLGAFRAGGPLIAGIAAAATGIGLLASRMRTAREEATKLDALERVTGITRREVDDLRTSLQGMGVELSRLEVAQLARMAQEARISKEEIVANAAAIQALATLDAVSFESAAKKFFQDLRREAASTEQTIQAIRDAIYALGGAYDPVLARGEEEIRQLQERRRQREEALRLAQEELRVAEQAWVYTRDATRQDYERYVAAQERVREAQAEIDAIDQQIERVDDYLVRYQLERERIEENRRLEEERRKREEEWARKQGELAAKAQAREKQALETALAAARARGDAEAVIALELERRMRTLDELARKEVITEQDLQTERRLAVEQAERERERLARERVRRIEDLELQHQARMASLTQTRLDDIEIALQQELLAVERQLEDQVIAYEEAEKRKQQIREYYTALREETARRETEAEQQRLAALTERTEQARQQAYAQGIQVGTALMSGLAQGMRQGDGVAVLRGILGAIALAATLFGGPVLGAALSGLATLFAGFFSQGGWVRGPRSARRDNLIAAVEDGEFIVNRQAAARHRGLLEAINAGRVPDFAGAFATGGLVGAAATAVGGPVQIYITALDPQETADVVAHRLEPVQRIRGMTRQDEAMWATVRPRLQPRTGSRR